MPLWSELRTAIRRLQEIAVEAANAATPEEPIRVLTPPTITALRDKARRQALTDWGQTWLDDPRRGSTFRALTHPLSGQHPEFMLGIAGAPRPCFFCDSSPY
jgi:hypothetical protein